MSSEQNSELRIQDKSWHLVSSCFILRIACNRAEICGLNLIKTFSAFSVINNYKSFWKKKKCTLSATVQNWVKHRTNAKFPDQKIRRNYIILCSVCFQRFLVNYFTKTPGKHLGPCQTYMMENFSKKALTISSKKLHHICLRGS